MINNKIVASSWSHIYLLIKDARSLEHKKMYLYLCLANTVTCGQDVSRYRLVLYGSTLDTVSRLWDRVTLCVGCMTSAIPRCWLLKDYHRTTYRASVEYVCEDHSAPFRKRNISYPKMFSSDCTWCIYVTLIVHVSCTSL